MHNYNIINEEITIFTNSKKNFIDINYLNYIFINNSHFVLMVTIIVIIKKKVKLTKQNYKHKYLCER